MKKLAAIALLAAGAWYLLRRAAGPRTSALTLPGVAVPSSVIPDSTWRMPGSSEEVTGSWTLMFSGPGGSWFGDTLSMRKALVNNDTGNVEKVENMTWEEYISLLAMY